MRKIDFVFFDAGGGHRSAAMALKAVAEQQRRPWHVNLMNLQEVLDEMDVFRKITGIRLQDIYNKLLANGWTWGAQHLLKGMQGVVRLYHPLQVRLLTEHWSRTRPDVIVSLVPNFNRSMREAIRNVDPRVPYITVLTDMADYPPHFWVERQDQYWICGTEKAYRQAREIGGHPDKVFLVSGMILRPVFYEPLHVDVAAERAKLGLDPTRPTGLVLFGGHGSGEMAKIARELQEHPRNVQLILICGRNEKLAAELRAMPTLTPMHVVGFTDQVPYFMGISDFFIGKPGPGSITEAIAMKLPVIVQRNSWTLPQERYNADWLIENAVGVVVQDFRHIEHAIDELLDRLPEYRANAAKISNRAVFEIPDLIDEIAVRS
jgi:1,2-diacylglycerol 3-beta-galactosyltransferase